MPSSSHGSAPSSLHTIQNHKLGLPSSNPNHSLLDARDHNPIFRTLSSHTVGGGGGREREGQVEVVEKEEGVMEEKRKGPDRIQSPKQTPTFNRHRCRARRTPRTDQRFFHKSTCDTASSAHTQAPASQGYHQQCKTLTHGYPRLPAAIYEQSLTITTVADHHKMMVHT